MIILKYVIHIFLFAGTILTLSSCDSEIQIAEQQVTLTPVFDGVHHTTESYPTGSCVGTNVRGTLSPEYTQWDDLGGAETVGLLTAYSNSFFRGADPFPCNMWLFHLFQAKLLFDLSSLPDGAIVTNANLVSTSSLRATLSRHYLMNSRDCAFEFGVAESSVIGKYTRGSKEERIQYWPGSTRPYPVGSTSQSVSLDVTRTVSKWLTGYSENENFGFIVAPVAGRTFQEKEGQSPQDSVYCAAYITDVSLDLTLIVPVH